MLQVINKDINLYLTLTLYVHIIQLFYIPAVSWIPLCFDVRIGNVSKVERLFLSQISKIVLSVCLRPSLVYKHNEYMFGAALPLLLAVFWFILWDDVLSIKYFICSAAAW